MARTTGAHPDRDVREGRSQDAPIRRGPSCIPTIATSDMPATALLGVGGNDGPVSTRPNSFSDSASNGQMREEMSIGLGPPEGRAHVRCLPVIRSKDAYEMVWALPD